MRLWLLDKLAKRYNTRPSTLCNIQHPLDAYQLDEAVFVFCAGVEAQLDAIPEPKGKKGAEKRAKMQQDKLNQLLQIPQEAKKFRDPADLLK